MAMALPLDVKRLEESRLAVPTPRAAAGYRLNDALVAVELDAALESLT
jgi:hypothetical protein